MANYCTIRNKKKLSLREVQELVTHELKNKFNLPVNSTLLENDSSVELEIHGWFFYINLYEKKFSFYDCSHIALQRNNQENPLTIQSYENSLYHAGISCGYSFIHEYIKHFLAEYMSTKIESDGAGKYMPFEDRSRFDSFSAWMDYCEDCVKKEPGLFHSLFRLAFRSKEKIIQQELAIFPELK